MLLGNIQPGDSMRLKGRGPIQNTGRFNNKMYGVLLHVVFVDQGGVRVRQKMSTAETTV